MIQIPGINKKFLQTNRGNVLGNLWSTFGIDLQDNPGAIRVGNMMKIINKTGDTNCTNLGLPTCFTAWRGVIACLGGTRVFFSNKLTADMVFAEDGNTGAMTDWSVNTDDLCLFNATLCGLHAKDSKLYTLDLATSGTWTSRGVVLAGATAGQLLYFKKFNRLYILDYGKHIASMDTSWAISTVSGGYDLSFNGNDDDGALQCFAAGSDRIWIGTKRSTSGGSSDNSNPNTGCSVYEWDGISSTPTKEYKIQAMGIMSITMRRDIPIILDTKGVLREYNGQGFVETGRLPLRRNQSLLMTAQPYWAGNFIHPRGLAITKDDTILALILNRTLFDYTTPGHLYENLPSGIWEFDGKGSAVMKHPITMMPISSTTVTDHGQNRLSLIGSLTNIETDSISTQGISSLFVGAEIYTSATATTDAILCDAPWPTDLATYPEGQKYGYFVTPFLQSQQARENWKRAFIQYRDLSDDGDKIILKYRIKELAPVEISITWTSTTTFTTTTNITGYVGYEVEGLQGNGSGKCSHILTVVNNSGTYTATVDETYVGCTSGTARVRLQNWIRAGSITPTSFDDKSFEIGKVSSRLQVKVCMQFTGDDEILQLAIVNATQQPFA